MAKKRTKYASIQKILSTYTKKKGIHLGKEFNKAASRIYQSNKNTSLKDIRKNIGKLYEVYKEPEKEFIPPSQIDFFRFEDVVEDDNFKGIEVNVLFKEMPEFEFSGIQLDALSLYESSGLRDYLRDNYSKSPVAEFILEYTDNKTTVTYRVDLHESQAEPNIKREQPSESINISDKDILLEREKQKTKKEERLLTKEKRLAYEAKSKLIQDLKGLGFSNEEIKKQLK